MYILEKIGLVPNTPVNTYKCDTVDDLQLIKTEGVPMGSVCYVINTGITYHLNSNKQWIMQPSGGGSTGGGGASPENIIYDGGIVVQ